MKINPITKEVFTDKDQLIKKLNCQYKINWNDLTEIDSTSRKCSKCENPIISTESLSDNELLGIVTQNPETCLKIDLNQPNVEIVVNGILEQR